MRAAIRWGILVLVVVSFILLLFALNAGQLFQSEEIRNLTAAEVRDYQGEHLSSVADFRENSIQGPQNVNITTYTLTVRGIVEKNTTFTYDQVLARFPHYRKVVTLYCVEGWNVKILWDGVLVTDLIDRAGPRPEATIVIFRAADGYSTSLPLAYIRERNILLSYAMNNVTLPPERGFPFELVAEDKWGYKWIKWVTEIELSDDPAYRGYWESRGYAQNGTLDRGYFDTSGF